MNHYEAPDQQPDISFADATGTIDYTFTNDYMFRSVLQENPSVLTSLICSLLHQQREEVTSVVIKNPIELGKFIEDKDFILDINVNFNNNTNINLEMQVSRQPYWCERSLCYLCRTYDQLGKGEDYSQVKPAVHIGFLDFTLFPDVPEFYATYKMLNVKNHHLYSDKFILSVVDLNHIKLATEEDKAYGIDYWAKLFRATTWEELKMIANKNEILEEASASLYKMNANEAIRERCQAREDYYRIQNSILSKLEA